MHFYNHNIKTWVAATAHLSDDEDLAYRRLNELYYDKEEPLENNPAALAKRIRMPGKVEAVAAVLAEPEFYTLGEDGRFHNPKCDEEIAKYRKMSEGGKKGAESRWKKGNENNEGEAPPIAPPSYPQCQPRTNNQKPRTKNQEYSSNTLPSLPADSRENGRFEKNGFEGVRFEGRRGFVPSERTIETVLSNCRGWNLQALLLHYEEYRRNNGEPNHPQAAFIGWAKKFTKGKPPT